MTALVRMERVDKRFPGGHALRSVDFDLQAGEVHALMGESRVRAKAEIYRLLEQLAEQGKTIMVISSELPEILRLSHRVAVMCERRLTGIVAGGSAQEDIMHLATQHSTLLDASGGTR
jgi:ABC-type sugar transport system ATPase subunit